MLEAACMAGFAFNRTGTAMVHALSFVLSEEWHVPHGAACAFTLEDAYRHALSEPVNRSRLARVAEVFFPSGGGPDDDRRPESEGPSFGRTQDTERDERLANLLLDRILELKRKMGLPARFSDLGVSVERKKIPSLFGRAFDDPKMDNTFPEASRESVFAFLEAKA